MQEHHEVVKQIENTGNCLNVPGMSLSLSFKTLTLINNWLYKPVLHERPEEAPFLWAASQSNGTLLFSNAPLHIGITVSSSNQPGACATKTAWQNAGAALMERDMQGYEWLHLRGNCCWAGASYLVSFSLLAIYGRSHSAPRRRGLI